MANLFDLLYLFLTEIARRLKKLEDYVSFRSVSTSMRAAAKQEYFGGLRLRQHTPYMMLSVRDGNDDIREFYSLVEGESIVASVKVPNFKSKKCLECLGWLLVSEVDGSMSLLDPFSGTEIPLPHQNTFPDYELDTAMLEYGFFGKMVLSSRPDETSDFVLMVIGGTRRELAFWRPGDKAWNIIDKCFCDVVYYGGGQICDKCVGCVASYCDVVYYGGGQFCAIRYLGVVWAFNLSGSDNQIKGRLVTNFMAGNRIPDFVAHFTRYRRLYILKTVNDSLLVISRSTPVWDVDDVSYITKKFQVYEVDIVRGTWKEIYSLGSMAVFLGHNSTIALDASRFPGTAIKANHIYFTDDNWGFYGHEDNEQGGGRDSGVYNLEMGSIEPVYPGEPLLNKVSPSTWITPCF